MYNSHKNFQKHTWFVSSSCYHVFPSFDAFRSIQCANDLYKWRQCRPLSPHPYNTLVYYLQHFISFQNIIFVIKEIVVIREDSLLRIMKIEFATFDYQICVENCGTFTHLFSISCRSDGFPNSLLSCWSEMKIRLYHSLFPMEG